MRKSSFLFVLSLWFSPLALAATPPATAPSAAAGGGAPDSLDILKGRPDVTPESEKQINSALLGTPYEDQSAGIAVSPPAGCKKIERAGAGDELVAYINEPKDWMFKVLRLSFSQPVPLTTKKEKDGVERQGVLDITLQQLQRNVSGAEVVRNDTSNIGDADVGLIALRYTAATKFRLTQQAIIEASEKVYYVIDLTTPGARPRSGATDDPAEKEAFATFSAILDSVKLLDVGSIKRDQDERLFRTRALFVNWTEAKLRSVLQPEQYLRILRDGKDIGYMYVVEDSKKPDGTPGVQIAIRSRSIPEAGTQADVESWMYSAFDRSKEDWSNVSTVTVKGQKAHTSEFGISEKRNSYIVPKSDDDAKDKGGIKLPAPIRQTELYNLLVTGVGKSGNMPPVNRSLPPWYLPQALGHLLPQLVPLREPKTYLFYSYVADRREVVLRYVDVGREADVTLDGKRVRAVPVVDRIGFKGAPTYHYMDPSSGAYLGSVAPESKILILPTDASTLLSLWKDAQLTKPELQQNPQLPPTDATETPKVGATPVGPTPPAPSQKPSQKPKTGPSAKTSP